MSYVTNASLGSVSGISVTRVQCEPVRVTDKNIATSLANISGQLRRNSPKLYDDVIVSYVCFF